MNAGTYKLLIGRIIKIVGWENGSICFEYPNGTKYWYRNGKPHRTNGPAAEYVDGTKFWYLNDKLHRANGPAVEWANGAKFWYLNDEEYTEEEFNKYMMENK